MKRFVIKRPQPGRSTATLVTHQYDPQTRRTRTVYLGCFSIHLNPDSLSDVLGVRAGTSAHGISLRPGASAAGAAFNLEHEDVQQLRLWLEVNGTHVRRQAEEAHKLVALASAAAIERGRIASEVEVELRGRLESEWRAEFSAAWAGSALERAIEALAEAGREVLSNAQALKAAGHRLTATGKRARKAQTPFDHLRERTVAVRGAAFSAFEHDCKKAGLMRGR